MGNFWILLIPLALLLSKWYFKTDPPTAKKGFILGLVGLVVGNILDLIITVPLFVKSYEVYYTNVFIYVGFLELLVITTYAGYEFDSTFTKRAVTEVDTSVGDEDDHE